MTCSCVVISVFLISKTFLGGGTRGGIEGDGVCEGIVAGWVTQYVCVYIYIYIYGPSPGSLTVT